MARDAVNIFQQIGVETTKGSMVAATKRFASLQIELGDSMETQKFAAHGAKENTTLIVNKEWAEGSWNGAMSYAEIIYPLAGMFPYVVSGSGAAKTWEFDPNPRGADPYKTYTLEDGNDDGLDRFGGLTFSSFNLDFGEGENSMSGDCFAYKSDLTQSTMTSSGVADIAERPVSPREVDIFIDTTFAGIGTTKLTDAFSARLAIPTKRQPKWVLNTDNQSYKEAVELLTSSTLTLTTEDNTQARALRTALRANPHRFIRVRAQGATITGSDKFTIQVDFAGKLEQKARNRDIEAVFGYEFTFAAIQEATMGRGYSILVINELAAL